MEVWFLDIHNPKHFEIIPAIWRRCWLKKVLSFHKVHSWSGLQNSREIFGCLKSLNGQVEGVARVLQAYLDALIYNSSRRHCSANVIIVNK